MTQLANPRIAIIGLGYVGLPLAVEFGKKYPVTGFDIKQGRIDELKAGRRRDPCLRQAGACAVRCKIPTGQGRGGWAAVSIVARDPALHADHALYPRRLISTDFLI
jgi:hypothetical protein